jgi:protein involved in polysaccharide export with SLBB domain
VGAPGFQTAAALQRVSEVVDKSGGFKSTSSLRNIEIRRTDGSLRGKADLIRYLAAGEVSANPVVEAGDVVVVPPVRKFVTISGAVANPGKIEFVEGDSLSTIIRLAHGLSAPATTDSVEISRFLPDNPTRATRMAVNYQSGVNPLIQDGDVIFIRSISEYHVPRIVSIGGEVRYPGRYAIDLGETRISDVLNRAGGVLPTGSLEESGLIRRVGVGSWESEPELIRLQSMGALSSERVTQDEYNYFIARMRQLGRTTMVVDFKKLMNGDAAQDILLRDEDSIFVPRARGYVNVSGSVNNQGNVNMIEGGTYLDYIAKAGGFTSSADASEVRIINARTSSYIDPTSDKRYQIGPGDIIVVPNTQPTFWKNFSTVASTTAQIITIIAGVILLFPRGN